MIKLPPVPFPTLTQRALELRALQLAGATLSMHAGRELRYQFSIAPSAFGRVYKCLLRVKPDSRAPEMLVLAPDLKMLAGGEPIPHIYPHKSRGTKLCLWWPRRREWMPQLKFTDTYLPWTAEWLWHFEDWLATGVWSGGGQHPAASRRSARVLASIARSADASLGQ